MEENYERFIDADEQEPYTEAVSYESIVVRQIQNCVNILSKEEMGGYMKYSSKGASSYVEDVKEQIINSIETLRMLLDPFTKSGCPEVESKLQEIRDEWNRIGEITLRLRGELVKVKDIGALDKNDPIMKRFVDFKSQKYRELFGVLVMLYNKRKVEIASSEIE